MHTASDKTRLYLQRMGIQLPWPEHALRQDATPTQVAPPASRRRLGATLADNPVETVIATPPAAITPAAPKPAAPPLQEGILPAFSLLALRRADGLMLLDSLSGEHRQWPAPRQRLALDLLAAWSGRHEAVTWQQALFWPRPLSAEDAGEMALGSLQGQHRQQPLQTVFCLGDTLLRCLAPETDAELLLSRALPGLPLRCLFLPRHPETLGAEHRRQLWCLLATLRDTA